MENDKFQNLVLDHLARLTQEMTEIRTDLGGQKSDISSLKSNVDEIKSSIIRIENDHGDKLRALFDAWESQKDFNRQILERFDRMEDKLDRLSLRVSAHDTILEKVK